jgi:hypothetical protein
MKISLLYGTTPWCPTCPARKGDGPFCEKCWDSLPGSLQQNILDGYAHLTRAERDAAIFLRGGPQADGKGAL